MKEGPVTLGVDVRRVWVSLVSFFRVPVSTGTGPPMRCSGRYTGETPHFSGVLSEPPPHGVWSESCPFVVCGDSDSCGSNPKRV